MLKEWLAAIRLSWKQRLVARIGAILTIFLWLVDLLDRARKIYEAPGTTRTLLDGVIRMISETSLMAWIILAVGICCLAFATLDLWWSPISKPIAADNADDVDAEILGYRRSSDEYLRKSALSLAAKMRAMDAEHAAHEAMNLRHHDRGAPYQRWQGQAAEIKRRYEAKKAAYNLRFGSKARAMRDELLRRIGVPPVRRLDHLHEHYNYTIDEGELIGGGLKEAAELLERLAMRLE